MADLTSFTFKEESKSHHHCYHHHSESPWNDAGTFMGFGRITEEGTTRTNDVRTSAAIDHNLQREEQPFKRRWWAEPMLKGWRLAVM